MALSRLQSLTFDRRNIYIFILHPTLAEQVRIVANTIAGPRDGTLVIFEYPRVVFALEVLLKAELDFPWRPVCQKDLRVLPFDVPERTMEPDSFQLFHTRGKLIESERQISIDTI